VGLQQIAMAVDGFGFLKLAFKSLDRLGWSAATTTRSDYFVFERSVWGRRV
jgi:hypothetical protein